MNRTAEPPPETPPNRLSLLIFACARPTIRTTMYEQQLRASLPRVEERIQAAVQRAGRAQDVRIVAVTKGHPSAAVQAAIAVGLHDCGENRVAELESKVAELGRDTARWHL